LGITSFQRLLWIILLSDRSLVRCLTSDRWIVGGVLLFSIFFDDLPPRWTLSMDIPLAHPMCGVHKHIPFSYDEEEGCRTYIRLLINIFSFIHINQISLNSPCRPNLSGMVRGLLILIPSANLPSRYTWPTLTKCTNLPPSFSGHAYDTSLSITARFSVYRYLMRNKGWVWFHMPFLPNLSCMTCFVYAHLAHIHLSVTWKYGSSPTNGQVAGCKRCSKVHEND
jgi:hypothetical protein